MLATNFIRREGREGESNRRWEATRERGGGGKVEEEERETE
jgi:hypothetical protein